MFQFTVLVISLAGSHENRENSKSLYQITCSTQLAIFVLLSVQIFC